MDIKESLEILEKNDKFVSWKKENSQCFLAHAFIMFDKLNQGMIQFGYYNPDTDKIITFITENGQVAISAESEIFKKPEAKLKELDLSKINIDVDKAMDILLKFKEENYSAEVVINSFMILQNIDEGQVYNFTYITQSFNTLNIKISTETGEVVDHSMKTLISPED